MQQPNTMEKMCLTTTHAQLVLRSASMYRWNSTFAVDKFYPNSF